MGSIHRSVLLKKSNESARLVIAVSLGVLVGYLLGTSLPTFSISQFYLLPRFSSYEVSFVDHGSPGNNLPLVSRPVRNRNKSPASHGSGDPSKIYVETNPHGAELLPPGIVVVESDFYLRRLWGDPNEDLIRRPKYLLTFTVGFDQARNIDSAVKKFSEDFTIFLFHYDGRTSEWDQYEWSRRAIHVSVKKQTKWWYAKRFLHPDVVAAYDYIFVWDEDLGLEHFNAEKYLYLVKKHGLEISQPGLDPDKALIWEMTKRRGDSEVHKVTSEKPGWCRDGPHLPPCAAFVEIMAPVFSRNAWRCVWHMIQNDLVHGWGLDFALQRCVEPAHEKIGVIDSEWIVHQAVPSLGNQVRERCTHEWSQFRSRLDNAEKKYFSALGNG